MSVLRIVTRATAVAALRGETWCESRVYDSDQTALAIAIMGQSALPYCVVYVDNDSINQVTGIGELYSGENRSMNVVLEIGVANAVRDPTGKITIQFAATDLGLELACDTICAQAIAALYGNPHSPWGNLFKRFVNKVRSMQTRRGGMSQSGVRFAARRITLVCQPMWDLVPGVVPAPQHPVYEFIRMAKENPTVSEVDVAGIVSQLLVTTQAPSWRVAQAYLGMTTRDLLLLNPGGSPAPLEPGQSQIFSEQPPTDSPDQDEWVPRLMEIELVGNNIVNLRARSLHVAAPDLSSAVPEL